MTVRSQAGLRNSAKPSSQAFLPLLHTWEHIWIIHLSDSSDSWKLEQSTYESQPAGCRKELSFKALLKKKNCIFRETFNFDIFKTEHMPRFELTVNGKRAAVLVPN